MYHAGNGEADGSFYVKYGGQGMPLYTDEI